MHRVQERSLLFRGGAGVRALRPRIETRAADIGRHHRRRVGSRIVLGAETGRRISRASADAPEEKEADELEPASPASL